MPPNAPARARSRGLALTIKDMRAIDKQIVQNMKSAPEWKTKVRGWVWHQDDHIFECTLDELAGCLKTAYEKMANFVSMELREPHGSIRCLPVIAGYASWRPGQTEVRFSIGRADRSSRVVSVAVEFECSAARKKAGDALEKLYTETIDGITAQMEKLHVPDQPGRLNQTDKHYSLFRSRIQGCVKEGNRLPTPAWLASTSIHLDENVAVDNAYKFATLFLRGQGPSTPLAVAAGMIMAVLAGDLYVTDVVSDGTDVDTYSSCFTNECMDCPCGDCEDKTKATLDHFEFLCKNINKAKTVPDDVKSIFSSGEYTVVMMSSILAQTRDYAFNDEYPHGHMFPLLVPVAWQTWVMSGCTGKPVDILGEQSARDKTYPDARFATLETVQQIHPTAHKMPREAPIFFERISHYHRTSVEILEHYGLIHMVATKNSICDYEGAAEFHPPLMQLLAGNAKCVEKTTHHVTPVPPGGPEFDAMVCSKPVEVSTLETKMVSQEVASGERICWISALAASFITDKELNEKIKLAQIATGPAACIVLRYIPE